MVVIEELLSFDRRSVDKSKLTRDWSKGLSFILSITSL